MLALPEPAPPPPPLNTAVFMASSENRVTSMGGAQVGDAERGGEGPGRGRPEGGGGDEQRADEDPGDAGS
jgi:hypothetical protein